MTARRHPDPVIEVAIEPKLWDDQEKLQAVLVRLAQEDSSFQVVFDPESNQTVIKGMSELQLDAIVDRMRREFGIALNVGGPQVAYRETISRPIEWEHTYHKHLGPTFPYAKVKIRFEPAPSGGGFRFRNAAAHSAVPGEFVPGVEDGLHIALKTGAIGGFPVVDLTCTLLDGAFDEVESSLHAFRLAARNCAREALPQARPQLLEPMMRVEVVTPLDYIGDVIGDLMRRHVQVLGINDRHGAQVIDAMGPLANMLGYANTLRAMTHDHAGHTMVFSHYEIAPPSGK